MGRLDGKVAVITGTTSGIGEATARLFVKEGARIVMGARRAERGLKLQKELTDAGYEAIYVETDVTVPSSCFNLIEEAVRKFGRIDILANIAGNKAESPYMLHESDEALREKLFKANLYGTIDTCRAAIPHMLKQGSGSIVNVASVAGLVACPHDSLYSSVKGAVKMLSVGMALDYADSGIRVNCICPGLTSTEIGGGKLEGSALAEKILAGLPLHRFAMPAEIANGILFLASDEASFACGTVLTIDGGEIIS